MNDLGNFLKNLLLAPFRAQTYLNLIYLFLAFPLGLFYFIFLVVGFSVGISLLIILIGLLVLLLVFAGWWAFVAFERQLAIWLLRANVPPLTKQDTQGKPIGEQIMAYLTNPVMWKGLIYLFLKFPLGILTFTITTAFVAFCGALLAAPLIVLISPLNLKVEFTRQIVWVVDTLPEGLMLFAFGIPAVWIVLNLTNGMAWLWARFSELMLGNRTASETVPANTELSAGPVLPADPVAAALPVDASITASGELFETSSEDLSPSPEET